MLCIAHWGSNPPGVANSNFLLALGLYPVFASLPLKTNHKLPSSLWAELTQRHGKESLRSLAEEYGVSHEAIRQTLAAMQSQITTD